MTLTAWSSPCLQVSPRGACHPSQSCATPLRGLPSAPAPANWLPPGASLDCRMPVVQDGFYCASTGKDDPIYMGMVMRFFICENMQFKYIFIKRDWTLMWRSLIVRWICVPLFKCWLKAERIAEGNDRVSLLHFFLVIFGNQNKPKYVFLSFHISNQFKCVRKKISETISS